MCQLNLNEVHVYTCIIVGAWPMAVLLWQRFECLLLIINSRFYTGHTCVTNYMYIRIIRQHTYVTAMATLCC